MRLIVLYYIYIYLKFKKSDSPYNIEKQKQGELLDSGNTYFW